MTTIQIILNKSLIKKKKLQLFMLLKLFVIIFEVENKIKYFFYYP